jgi:hypothetical protein
MKPTAASWSSGRQYATQIEFRYIHEKMLSLICEHRVLFGKINGIGRLAIWAYWLGLSNNEAVSGCVDDSFGDQVQAVDLKDSFDLRKESV